jgi:carbamoyl-phosphate synthase large subunit
MLKDIVVMITGAGAPGAPGIIKSLRLNGERNIKVVGVDANLEESIGIGLVDKVYQISKAKDKNFISEILKICQTEKVDVIIPLVTMELFVFSKNKKLFEENNIKVQVSEYEQLNIANNKYNLMQFCKENDVPYPEFYIAKSIREFEEKAKLLGYPKKKICFKPPISNGLRGFRIINDSTDKMGSLINEKPNNVYIGYAEFLQIARDADYFPDLLLMEFLPGEEFSVDVMVNNGKCHAVIPRSRDKIKMGISFVGTTVEDKEIIKYSKQLVESLKLNGNIGLQFKRDTNGVPKIIESNPRVQGTIVLCTASGYNMIYNSVKIALGEELIDYKINWNTKMIRYWDEIYINNNGRNFKI